MPRYKKEKHISRIDSGNTHCWTVRIMEKQKIGIYRTFSDGVFGGKEKAWLAAIEFRDKCIEGMPCGAYVNHKCVTWPAFRSKGYYFSSKKRETKEDCKYCVAFCYDKFTHTNSTQSFGFVRWGGKKKARLRAIAWRNRERIKVEKKARALGLRPPRTFKLTQQSNV